MICAIQGKKRRRGKHKCKICGQHFIKRHIAEAHQHKMDVQIFYSCSKCPSYETTKMGTLTSHWDSKHEIQNCNQCGKTFNCSKSLWYHKKTVHVSRKRINAVVKFVEKSLVPRCRKK